MRPVVGIDVAKGQSVGMVFLDKNKPFKRPFRIEHSSAGFDEFNCLLQELKDVCGIRPDIIFEATGHYHLPILNFLEDQEYYPIIVNPLVAQRARKAQLRKVKTDEMDAYHLAEMYYRDDFEPMKHRNVTILNLRNVTRQHEMMTKTYVQHQLNFQAVLDQVFPFYVGVFSDLFSASSLRLLQEFPTPQAVLQAGMATIAERIREMNTRSKSLTWAQLKAQKLIHAAEKCPTYGIVYESHLFTLNLTVELLLQYREHLRKLEEEIDALARSLEEYDLLRSIPGIGNKTAATILSEIGDIERFDHPKKVVAFAGVDPSVYSSGNFTSTSNRVTKRGSKQLRRALYLAVQCGLRKNSTNHQIRVFYEKKRSEGKAYKVALMACMNKLLHQIYAILKRRVEYRAYPVAT